MHIGNPIYDVDCVFSQASRRQECMGSSLFAGTAEICSRRAVHYYVEFDTGIVFVDFGKVVWDREVVFNLNYGWTPAMISDELADGELAGVQSVQKFECKIVSSPAHSQ